jgi:hypothetical protein
MADACFVHEKINGRLQTIDVLGVTVMVFALGGWVVMLLPSFK